VLFKCEKALFWYCKICFGSFAQQSKKKCVFVVKTSLINKQLSSDNFAATWLKCETGMQAIGSFLALEIEEPYLILALFYEKNYIFYKQ